MLTSTSSRDALATCQIRGEACGESSRTDRDTRTEEGTRSAERADEVGVTRVELATFAADFAVGLREADARLPVAINQRSKQAFKPGIGPHTEAQTVDLVMKELQRLHPDRYDEFEVGVPYPAIPRQKCDLCVGRGPHWDWAIEVKMLRLLGDNGQPNDNMLMHILSPYPEHRSALTDCMKLLRSGLVGRKAIVIYGYGSDDWPLAPAVDAFELLAQARAKVGQRIEACFDSLVHPVHKRGSVFGWELLGDPVVPATR